jgi:hypothetical protein
MSIHKLREDAKAKIAAAKDGRDRSYDASKATAFELQLAAVMESEEKVTAATAERDQLRDALSPILAEAKTDDDLRAKLIPEAISEANRR